MLQQLPPPIIWECVMPKDYKKPKSEECPVDLTPVEEAQAATLDDSGGGGNTNPPKPGGK